MKKVLIFLIFGIFLIIILTMNFPLRERSMYGKYINTNYGSPICCVESPHQPDTLILFRNGTFKSNFYGKGTFTVNNGINPTIELRYPEFGKSARFKTYFSNIIFENPKIVLNTDMNHFYTKTN
jgi:hypothetical protein